ncbi:MAG: ATP-binding protein [Candidatus Eremiobacteraeota bacterium]|nr:ATP-binding protein [Candidatus Eremiobacteraeota bacterium]
MSLPEPSSDYLGTVELRIPSKPEWVAVARLAVAAIANRLPFSVEEIEDLKLAIAEACTICIQQGGAAQSIDITCEAALSHLRVEVRDHRYRERADSGLAKRAVTAVEGEGLGIFLIQALMDDLEYSVDPQLGTELVMTKRVGA